MPLATDAGRAMQSSRASGAAEVNAAKGFRLTMAYAAPVADRGARSARHGGGDPGELLHPLRGDRAGESPRRAGPIVPGFVVYAGFIYFALRPAQGEVALRLAARPVQHRARLDRAGDLAAGARLHPGLAECSTARSSSARSRSLLYWFLQMAFLAGRASPIAISAMRARAASRARRAMPLPTLVLGRAADAEVLLRAIESGAVKKNPAGRHPVAVARRPRPVDPRRPGARRPRRSRADRARRRGARHARRAAGPDAVGAGAEARRKRSLMRARRLGLQTSRLPSLDEGGEALRLAPVAVEDLLLRPSVKIDYQRLEAFRAGQVDRRHRRRRLDRRRNLRPRRHLRRGAAAGDREFRAGAACGAGDAGGQGHRRRDRRPPRRRARPRAHLPPVRRFQARHRVPCRGAQARAAARARLGRGRQDQRVRLGQCRRRRGRGRRRRDGDDLDRQGDRAGVGARRHQALCRDVLPGARRRFRAPRRGGGPRCG